jgi:hypothetical protein
VTGELCCTKVLREIVSKTEIDDLQGEVLPNCEMTRYSEGGMRLDMGDMSDRNAEKYQNVVKA